MTERAQDIVSFWRTAGPSAWFQKSDTFDAEIHSRFVEDVVAARDGALDDWQRTPTGALALLLLLDQFPRNIFRDTPEMFASDDKACAVADAVIAAGTDREIDDDLRAFAYMPFMHSERLEDQARSVALFSQPGLESNVPHAKEHADIIERFGRFPHRNAILGRPSNAAEEAYLAGGGFKG